ncbi:MAG: hypothetical protein GFH27_549327n76 [Chloroflexi bacterium AL-W]|nr:hypothetical protein [Chloroflexi bacterium AL-N1]NOK69688.1 hypothetical protein [Chloroflexi bacterium AL-N10]NOK72235.1 hypothetical protein [Chloroflexi bacterium AL-N5]NOK85064.1 hypothetical protein [Chloroflexi bacterium AL-W]NOK91817.1 hypothetical protein [Chloroflexi bacterium AL-N15]
MVSQINDLLQAWDVIGAQDIVTRAEIELGGQAAAQLTLVCAIQRQRISANQFAMWDATAMRWVQAQATWSVACGIARSGLSCPTTCV